MWLLDNADAVLEDEVEEKEKKDEKKEEEKKEPEEEKKAEKEKQAEGHDSQRPPEDKYPTNAAAHYFLSDCFSFPAASQRPPPSAGTLPCRSRRFFSLLSYWLRTAANSIIPNEWEEQTLPDLKRFMESDGFSRLEIDDFLVPLLRVVLFTTRN